LGHRLPLEYSAFSSTITAIRALQAYAPKPLWAEYEKPVQRAAGWLATAQPETTEDRACQLLGLGWTGGDKAVIRKAAAGLLALQRADGGWAQTPTLSSDAFATGQVLVGLRESGGLATTDPAYQRAVKFLLNSQAEDGSWYVAHRAAAIQPYFESGFPYGHDQWISAAATNWAAMALAPLAR
jgi:squalene cyclase